MSTTTTSTSRTSPSALGDLGRWSGIGGLTFVLTLLVDTAIRSGAPQFGASGSTLMAYVEAHRTAMTVPIALFPLGLVGLFSFLAGLRSAARHDPRSQWWVDLGSLAVVTIAALFAGINLVEAAMVAAVHEQAASPAVMTALWAMDGGAFGLNLAAIGVALLGLAHAARATGLVPAWLAVVALPGAACLLLASVFAVAIDEGAAWLFLALAGFLVWALFVLVAAVAMVRAPRPRAP
jgi:hypothetical protein